MSEIHYSDSDVATPIVLTSSTGDTVYLETSRPVVLSMGSGDDTVWGGSGEDRISGGMGADTLTGGYGEDTINGDDGDDFIFDGGTVGREQAMGHDTVHGGQGNDTIFYAGSTEAANLYGDQGNDLITGSGGNDVIFGDGGQTSNLSDGADVIRGGRGDDIIHGGGGNDTIRGSVGEGADSVYAGDGDDYVSYFSDDAGVTLHGDAGNDVLVGGLGADEIFGGDGNDIIDSRPGGGNDLHGGAGNDLFVVRNQSDHVFEAADEGFDIVFADGTDYSLSVSAIASSVEVLVIGTDGHIGGGTSGDDYLATFAANVLLFGGGGNDTFLSYGINNTLYGSTGDDTYMTNSRSVNIREAAGEGADTLFAENTDFSLADAPNVENLILSGNGHIGAGTNSNDLLISQGISNQLFGGEGNDVFSFTPSHGATQALDYNARPNEHDLVAFSKVQFVDFTAVQAHLAQMGGDAVITAADGTGDTFILRNIVAASLNASDFLFV